MSMMDCDGSPLINNRGSCPICGPCTYNPFDFHILPLFYWSTRCLPTVSRNLHSAVDWFIFFVSFFFFNVRSVTVGKTFHSIGALFIGSRCGCPDFRESSPPHSCASWSSKMKTKSSNKIRKTHKKKHMTRSFRRAGFVNFRKMAFSARPGNCAH